MSKAPVLVAAHTVSGDGIVTLSTGVRARIVPVAASLVDDVTSLIKDPSVPTYANPDKEGREEPNPADPKYIEALAEARKRRAQAGIDALILFGVELVDGLPEGDAWKQKIAFMARRGLLNMDEFDLADALDAEFIYKKYIAVASDDLKLIGQRSGLSREAVEEAKESFPGGEERGAD